MIGEMTANCTKNQMTAIFPDDGVVVTCRRVFLQNFNPLPISRKKIHQNHTFNFKKNCQKNSVKITTLNFTKNIGKFVKITPSISRKYVKKVRQNYTFYFTKNIGYIEARVQFLPKKSRISYRKIHSGKLFLRSG